jgi:hypothetical protein
MDEYNAFKGVWNGPHDGVILKNTKDEGDVYVPKTPQQIRSRFAAFDPKKKKSADLLAGVTSLGLLPAGVAASRRDD